MTESVAVRGVIATDPRHLVTQAGVAITSFRLVSTRRRFNRDTGTWEDAERNWYTVSSFRRLALSAAGCLAKGDPVLVTGRLAIREWMGEHRGITAEIEADSIGHDLSWGSSTFTRSPRAGSGTDPVSDGVSESGGDPGSDAGPDAVEDPGPQLPHDSPGAAP
ncbi:single-stranded DNA-binding protein [Leifsonia sp. NPDC080035]|uniref:Single-stranded DNA-binding protein n=1 Tax=Leifsonia sp. NPDC080035 TaxID=3143936 RepID=A0AAU7GB00_9MICO